MTKAFLLGFSILAVAFNCYALRGAQDLIHVSKSGADNAGCGSAGNPCATPQFADQYLDGGVDESAPDIMYVHAGTYNVQGPANYNSPAIQPGFSNCKITAFGNDEVILDGGPAPTNFVLGALGKIHVTISNLKIRGVVTFRSAHFLTFENNEVYEGCSNDPQLGEWRHLFFIEASPNSVIRNNLFRDLGTPFGGKSGNAIVHYGMRDGDEPENVHFEYNSFIRAGGVFLKDNPEEIHIHHNYFQDAAGVALMSSNQDGPAHNIYFHNNVVNHAGSEKFELPAIWGMIEVTGFHIYNNTFVNSEEADLWSKWINELKWDFHNNITINNGFYYKMGHYSQTAPTIQASCTYMDYNAYYGSADWMDKCGSNCTVTKTSLSEWKTYLQTLSVAGVSDASSISLDPALSNSSGTSSADFRLTAGTPSQIKTGGRGGSFPSYRGAWDPNAFMYIGECPQGVGQCDVPGDADAGINDRVTTSVAGKGLAFSGAVLHGNAMVVSYESNGRYDVSVSLHDAAGRIVAQTVSVGRGPGRNSVRLPVSMARNGVYMVKLTAGTQRISRKLAVVR